MGFDEFLNTPVEMYRGGHGQNHIESDIFSAYSFERSVAEKFAGEDGTIYTAKIRPIDTYGSVFENKESEIFVPSAIAPNGNKDSNLDGGHGSGNHNHKGRKGLRGGSAPEVSAEGENVKCKGFKDKEAEDRHVKHLREFPGLTFDEYKEKGIDFLSKPCGGSIKGYATESGEIARFNEETGEYAKGQPGGIMRTYFIAKADENGKSNIALAKAYYERLYEKEGIK